MPAPLLLRGLFSKQTGSLVGILAKNRPHANSIYSGRFLATMANSDDAPVVLVTGASGFIATHVVKKLQEEGYRVRGTVRSLKSAEKIDPLRKLCPDAKYPLELVEADLLKPETWKPAVEGCTYVMHMASPFPGEEVKDPDNELVKPAVEGTESVLKACQDTGVKRVVMTSSFCTMVGGMSDPERDGHEFQDTDWVKDPSKVAGYFRSKCMSEKKAWEIHDNATDDKKFELAMLLPTYTVGPVLCGSFATAMLIGQRMMNRELPALPPVYFSVIDVRDVAEAHYKAMIVPEAAGHRHILNGGSLWMQDIAKSLAKEFKPHGYKVYTNYCPYWVAWLLSFFDGTTALLLPTMGCTLSFNTDRMSNVLGIKPRSAEEAFKALCYSIIDNGYVKKTPQYKGAPPGYLD